MLSCNNKEAIDTIIYGTIYTVNDSFTVTEAVAIHGGKILETGTKETIGKKYRAKENIDATGKFVYPGFIDAHCHFSGYALDLYKCDLTGTHSYNEIIEKLVHYEKNNRLSWIYGRGWDQNDWEHKEYPSKEILDSLFPGKPVILKRIDGHAILCNQYALDKAGIDENTVITGGIIEKKNGKLTGILIDNASEPVEALIPILPREQAIGYLKEAELECFSYGLTGVVDCGVRKEVIELLLELYKDSLLSIGNTLLLAGEKATLNAYIKKGPLQKGQLQVSGIKIYADGALGSRGAYLLKEYSDMPGHRGLLLTDTNEIKRIADEVKTFNWQLCTHAIGDGANSVILKIYAAALQQKNDRRWRIEHAQVVHPSDLHYYADYSIVPSVQPTHATSDMPWAGDRLGATRLVSAYAYKDLMQQNGWIALGTDFPVEAISPVNTFYAAVARKDESGHPTGGFQNENALTRIEALKGMTIWAAKSIFKEKEKGSLEPGKDADIVILDKDIMTLKEEEILSASPVYTLVKGRIKYQN